MNGPSLLQENVGVLKSRMGTFYPGSHVVFRGHDLHTELNDMDWVELYMFGVTGRRFSKEQLRLMHSIWTYTSYPDVRLWNNRVAALAGSSRSTGTLGMAAALAVSEASIYGRGIDMRAYDFLHRTRRQVEAGGDLLECIRLELDERRSVAGYGRPLVNGDERNRHMLALAKSLGLDQGHYLRLAMRIEETMLGNRLRMKMNYAGLVAALMADIGFSPKEYYLYSFPAFLAGMSPCFIEASERPEGTLYPIPCTDILYEGESKRTWPK
ncbi:MAG: citryl-CoA lyase [Gammaproteobacteria bacterium]|nr:citryl-CoA lyase [Gammaproteobacteria bacterium]MBU1777248.1 citryl-CoA lyase [Gammaproteobacteria bacterium]MBU1967856.1 citryl-CoA lyase [Gammaproteobacteria bacterium]